MNCFRIGLPLMFCQTQRGVVTCTMRNTPQILAASTITRRPSKLLSVSSAFLSPALKSRRVRCWSAVIKT